MRLTTLKKRSEFLRIRGGARWSGQCFVLETKPRSALDAGALGFIPKDTTSAVMLSALRLVLSGGIYVPPAITTSEESDYKKSQHDGCHFTPRQLQTLAFLAQGYSNKEIARSLGLSEATVKMHVTAIFKTLGVTNRTQAVLAVEKLGLTLPEIDNPCC